MICPNCGNNMSDKRKRCDRCGTDLTIYKKILKTSNLYYNDGLARAKVRDLSGAIIALRKSLDLNKHNTNARNLLGLIYYEMGETVAALSEWVISRHFQPKNNDAEDYINRVQNNPTKLDALNQAIKRYNTALGLAKQGSDDLAIIQLKKVVTLNTNFIRAYQLLALLLMKTGENERAKRLLLKAQRIDVTNTTTLRYLQNIEAPESGEKDIASNPEAEQAPVNTIMPVTSYREDKPNIMAFVNLVIGVVIGIAVTAFLIVPTIKKNQTTGDDTPDYSGNTAIAQLEEKENEISSLKNDIAELEHENEQLRNQIDNFELPEDNSAVYNTLSEATNLYLTELAKSERDRSFTAIADLLSGIDDSKLTGEAAINLYNQLKDASYLEAAAEHYKDGHDLYSDGKYNEALEELHKAFELDPTDVDAAYFLGRAYHKLDDKENAALYYNIVINEFPDSDRVSSAKGFLREVQEE